MELHTNRSGHAPKPNKHVMVPVAKLPVAAMRLAGATGPSGIKPSGCAADCAGDDEPVPGAKCKQVVLSVTVSKSSKKKPVHA